MASKAAIKNIGQASSSSSFSISEFEHQDEDEDEAWPTFSLEPCVQFGVDPRPHSRLGCQPTCAILTERTPMADLKKLYDSIVSGDAKTTQAITQQALAEGVDPL